MTEMILGTEPIQSRHLDARALGRLRDKLMSDRSAQAALAGEQDATVRELAGQGDVDSLLERELAEAAAARAREAIDDIDSALTRMDAGTYGSCESCGRPIAVERLDAIPHTRLCVACPGARLGLLW
jgi:RNA polymerase-binding transcription factor DksA